jgi:hydrogenase maturation protease
MSPSRKVRVIALGSPHGGDDEVMLTIAEGLVGVVGVELVVAGRPGAGLVELLGEFEAEGEVEGEGEGEGEGEAPPVLILDVVRSGAAAGTIHELELGELLERSVALEPVSSHGFGPAEALRLAAALGRPLPRGRLLGIEGECFTIGAEPSPAVAAALPELDRRVWAAITQLHADTYGDDQDGPCTSRG